MAEPLRAEGAPVGLGQETVEVLVEVFYEDQGLSPKVDFYFFKQVVFFHLNEKPKDNLTGDVCKSQSRSESYQMQKRCVPSPTERGPTLPVNTSVYTPLAALKVTYFHSLYFSTREEFFSPDLT